MTTPVRLHLCEEQESKLETFLRTLETDSKCQAKWENSWYPATVSSILRSDDGVISGAQVHFDDGDEKEYTGAETRSCLRPPNMRAAELTSSFRFVSTQLYGTIVMSSSVRIDFPQVLSGSESFSIVPRDNAKAIQTLRISFEECMFAPMLKRIELHGNSLRGAVMCVQTQTIPHSGCVVPDRDALETKLSVTQTRGRPREWDVGQLPGTLTTSLIVRFENNTAKSGDVRLKLFMQPIQLDEKDTFPVPVECFSEQASHFSFTSLFGDEESSDLRIRSQKDGTSILAHSLILRKLPYFRSLLKWERATDVKDGSLVAATRGPRVVGMDACGDILRLVVRFAYGFSIPATTPLGTCIRLTEYAKLYMLPALSHQVAMWLQNNLTQKSVGLLLSEVKRESPQSLMKPVFVHALARKGWLAVRRNIDELVRHPEFLKKLVRRIGNNEAFNNRMRVL
jgi:hypothetical protein